MTDNNPANSIKTAAVPSNYIPMSAPIQRLSVPEREGYVRYWFRGEPARLHRALSAGYQFVHPDDVHVNNFDLGGSSGNSGNTDLGTRVSMVSGDEGSDGNPGRLYLMEIPQELYDKGQESLQERNESVASALRSGLLGSDGEDAKDKSARYSKSGVPDLFNPNKRRR